MLLVLRQNYVLESRNREKKMYHQSLNIFCKVKSFILIHTFSSVGPYSSLQHPDSLMDPFCVILSMRIKGYAKLWLILTNLPAMESAKADSNYSVWFHIQVDVGDTFVKWDTHSQPRNDVGRLVPFTPDSDPSMLMSVLDHN